MCARPQRCALRNAFSYHPPYYNFEVEAMNYYDIGPQNSRGFRALKVWLALQHAGAAGYREMIQDDIVLARYLYDLAADHPELEAITHNLSITTLRYVPQELRASLGSEQTEEYLNQLNQRLLAAIEKSGEAFISNAVIGGKYALRFCIVNFRASAGDIEAMPQLVVRLGRQAHAEQSNPIKDWWSQTEQSVMLLPFLTHPAAAAASASTPLFLNGSRSTGPVTVVYWFGCRLAQAIATGRLAADRLETLRAHRREAQEAP